MQNEDIGPVAPIQWSAIDTLLLDMDGTLLDLHYDNQFWVDRLPELYAAHHGTPMHDAQALLTDHFSKVAGTLNWYCLDYWQQALGLPIRELKRQYVDLIKMRDDVPPFLAEARAANKRIVLVTNAHPDALALKNQHTTLESMCDVQYSTHEFGACKEDQLLWQRLQAKEGFDPKRSLFIDDGEHILDSAQRFGVAHLLGVENPDSKLPPKTFSRHRSFDNYAQLQPIIQA
ncbi:MAG: GMP/IMP nucleotidase [Idiomarina sp.]|nr:GMP/IMP nucleotidase [Idiomarina sp.]